MPGSGGAGARRTAWFGPPPELCALCRNPVTSPAETSAWNGRPAHRDCVRIHLLQRDPAFRDWGGEPASEDVPEEPAAEAGPREDDEDGTD